MQNCDDAQIAPLTFRELLKSARLTKQALADRLGLARPSVSRWGAECPQYARAYLELLVRWQALECARVERIVIQPSKPIVERTEYTHLEKFGGVVE